MTTTQEDILLETKKTMLRAAKASDLSLSQKSQMFASLAEWAQNLAERLFIADQMQEIAPRE